VLLSKSVSAIRNAPVNTIEHEASDRLTGAFMIRDGGIPSRNITIVEAMLVFGGALDGDSVETGHTMRGDRILANNNYECTWELFKSILSIEHPISRHDKSTKMKLHAVLKAFA
jgi:myosin-crossreactive antigen